MQIKTKGDLVRAALRKLGVASDATLTDVEPQSMQDAVDDLEAMMAEWYQDGKGIITGYVFSDDDNPPAEGDDHGLRSSAVSAVFHNLACRIAPDYALEATAKIIATAKYGKELLYKQTAISRAKRAPYPSRMPTGSGNSFANLNEWHYFPGEQNADSTTPMMKGMGKDFKNADYIDYLPVNMLATPKEILNSSGYLRSFPGITKRYDMNGVSRGVEYNTAQNAVYRVCGGKLYKGESEVGDVAGSGRVSMAHGRTSQAVGVNGQLVEYRYDGTVKTVSNWPADSGFTQYELGSVRDITRLRGRYAWSKDGTDSWFITDLEDESHPDRYSAQYRAESQPDGIIGIGTWRDFIVCFGSSTIEYFSLTGATTAGAALYVAQPSLMVQKGIAGTYCKTPFADSYAFISHPATGAPSVYIIGSGQASPIATASIEKIIRSYTAEEMATGVMETLRFDSHELLIIHLPRHVLVYDASSSQNGPQWCVLKTGLYDDVYRGVDFMYEGNQITCGDKSEAVVGQLQFDISSQYDKQQEHLLFTPLFKADNARCFDLEVESSTGVAQYADRLFLSATTDGINYGREQMIEQNEPFVYDKRVLWKRVGRIRRLIGFKLRVITKSPVTLSGCQIRLE